MRNLRSIFCVLVVFIVCMIQAEGTTEIRENFANVTQKSKDLACSVGSFLHSVGSEAVNQTQKLGSAIATYVESLQKNDDGLIQIEIQENEENVTAIINGLENIDPATCCDAKIIVMESWPLQIWATIQINPDTTLTLSSTKGRDSFSVSLTTTSKQVVEENNDAAVVKASASKQENIAKQITTAWPVVLEELTIDLDAAANQMIIKIPYAIETVKSVPVNIK